MKGARIANRGYWLFGITAVSGLLLAWPAAAYGQEREEEPYRAAARRHGPGERRFGPGGPHLEPPPPGPAPRHFGFVSPEQTEQLMEFLQEHFPRRHRMLRRLRERDPEEFQGRIAELAPKVLELLLRMKDDPELGELLLEQQKAEEELRAVVGRYHALDEEDQAEGDELRTHVEEIVSRLVEIRLERREHEIAALERRLDKERQRLDQDRESRDELVAHEIQELLSPRGGAERFRRRLRQERRSW